MQNKNYRSKITPILLDIAKRRGYSYVLSEDDPDAGYISVDNRKFYFTYGTLDLNTEAATEFARNKFLSTSIVRETGVRLPLEKHIIFSLEIALETYISDVKRFVDQVGLPFIVKPLQGARGKNVFKIESIDEIDFAIRCIASDEDDFLVQEYIDAVTEVRVVLLDGSIIQCYSRDYVHVIGDGSSTVQKLIEKKNAYFINRQRNTNINIQDSQIQSILKAKKYAPDSVLTSSERLNLSHGRNLSKGGEYEFVENLMSRPLVDLSKEIAKVAGLRLVGLDLLLSTDVSHVKEKGQITFIEYNASPDMENNFYYDGDYSEILYKMYESIFDAIVKIKI